MDARDHATALTQPIPGYEVLEQVGSGGMSSVYKARHKKLDRLVALKVLRRDQIDQGLALARLVKEARVLSRLDHPNIVRSLDFGEAGELVFFVMELVDGRSCKQVLIDRGAFPMREVLLIGEKVAAALGHAARHGVIHRDVKPGNILLARDGSVKLTDFGLARATRDRSLTQDGTTVGTPQYMSPEQVRSPRRVDLRSDLYSLGATLYHLATGHPPLRGESVGEILHEVLYAVPKPPEQLVPGLPPSFSRLLARLLAKDPRRRYGSAEEVIADLHKVRASFAEPEAGDEVGLSWQEAAEPPPRRAAGAWVAVAAGAVVVAVAVVLWRGGRDDEGVLLADSKRREEAMLATLEREWQSGARPPAELIARIGELKREGHLTGLSSLARVDLVGAAGRALEEQLRSAAARAAMAGRSALARGDFAAARAALADAFEAEVAQHCPEALRDELQAAGVEPLPWIQSARSAVVDAHDALEQEARRAVRQSWLRGRGELSDAIEEATTRRDFAGALARLAAYPAQELATCVESGAAVLRAAGVALAGGLSDDELRRGWPEAARAEFERDPAASFVADLEELVRSRAARLGRELELDAQREAERALADARAGRSVDLDGRRRAFEAEFAAPLAGLDAIDARPAGLAARWERLATEIANLEAQVRFDRETAAREQLLRGDGEGRAGIVALLGEREVAAARASLAAVQELAAAERAAWQRACDDVAAVLERARLDLAGRAGSRSIVRDRQGVAASGLVAFEPDGTTFAVGRRSGLRVEHLALQSLEEAIAAALAEPRRALAVRFLLGDPRERAALEAELDRGAGDPVVDALRRELAEQREGARERAARDEAAARDSRARLDAALARKDATAAREALRELQRLPATAAGRAMQGERSRLLAAIDAIELESRRAALLHLLAPHAGERVLEQDGSVRVAWSFDRPEEGEEWNVNGIALRIESGRLRFVGGEHGDVGAAYGAAHKFPLDPRAPASLKVELMPTLGERGQPRFVALRAGAACAVFFRPEEPLGERFPPQLALWAGTLDPDEWRRRCHDPALVAEPELGRVAAVGLERGRHSEVELRWLPDPARGTVRLELALDGETVHDAAASLADARVFDALELRSRTELQVERVELRGRLLE